jgi:thiamine biosynthesis protein ThiS
MKIFINGEEREIPPRMTILQLLEHLKLDTRVVAVEHNLYVVPKGEYRHRVVEEGDKLELVQFVGGG